MKETRGPKFFPGMVLIIAVALMLPALQVLAESPDISQAAEHLSAAVRFKTISFQDPAQVDAKEFKAFHAFLAKTYPLVHKNLSRETVSDLGLLYTWKGSDPSAKPVLLLAHIDVVPIAPGTLQDWTQPPFEGVIADGFIWGRGTMDCKGFLIAEMEAVESLLARGYQPRRTIYLCFGHDEEVGGPNGAARIAALLKSRGVGAEYVIDEGGMIVDGKIMGVSKPIAMIGIAEKGYLTLELKVKTKGGHSSMPSKESAIGILSRAISRLEQHPFPARLKGVTETTFVSLAPELSPSMRMAIKNRRLLGGVIIKFLEKNPATAAAIRTTTAPTIFNAGSKENVLPQEAKAAVNFRLLPGDSIGYVVSRVKTVINDPRVSVEPVGQTREASKISALDSEGFRILEKTVKQMFPDTLSVPFLVLGGTDARNYEQISDSLYRFAPMRVGEKDQERGHGTNERVSLDNYRELIEFYTTLIRNSE